MNKVGYKMKSNTKKGEEISFLVLNTSVSLQCYLPPEDLVSPYPELSY